MGSKVTETWVNTIKMTLSAPNPLGWLLSKKQKISSVGENVEKSEPCGLLVGMLNSAVAVENGMVVPENIENRTTR